MLYAGYLAYVLQHVPFLCLRTRSLGSGAAGVLLPGYGLYSLALALRYSYVFRRLSLVDLGGYDVVGGGVGARRHLQGTAVL